MRLVNLARARLSSPRLLNRDKISGSRTPRYPLVSPEGLRALRQEGLVALSAALPARVGNVLMDTRTGGGSAGSAFENASADVHEGERRCDPRRRKVREVTKRSQRPRSELGTCRAPGGPVHRRKLGLGSRAGAGCKPASRGLLHPRRASSQAAAGETSRTEDARRGREGGGEPWWDGGGRGGSRSASDDRADRFDPIVPPGFLTADVRGTESKMAHDD